MAKEAARGLIEAFDERLMTDAAWGSIVPYWDRIVATANRAA